MSEPSGDHLARICKTFIEAYNTTHGTDYGAWDPVEAQDDALTDVLFKQTAITKVDLKVQLVVAALDNQSEFAHPAAVQEFIITPLRDTLKRMASRGFVIFLRIDQLPKKSHEKAKVFPRLFSIVAPVLVGASPERERLIHVDRRLFQQYGPISAYLCDLEVCQVEGDAPTSIIHQTTAGPILIDVESQAAASLAKKMNKYGPCAKDHVLVVHCDNYPHDETDAQKLRDALGASPARPDFREVWLVSAWRESSADRVWPLHQQ